MAQVVEGLPRKDEALSLNPRTTKKTTTKKPKFPGPCFGMHGLYPHAPCLVTI
jgi:hypothetical protein